MRNLINLLRGTVEISIHGVFPERLINLCAQQHISFWGVNWIDEYTFEISVHKGNLKRLQKLGEKIGCTITKEKERGIPVFLKRFQKRYAFLVGLMLSLICVGFLSQVVLSIEVKGNEVVPTSYILGELRRLGLHTGVYGPLLERKQIAQDALLKLEDLSWMTINLYGTKAEVLVREVVKQPEILEKDGWYDITAKADGIVIHIEAHNGQSQVKEGDTVLKGDVLISGNVRMEPPVYSEQPVRYFQTQARGKVLARTWRTITAKIPLNAQVKKYTGEEETQVWINVFGQSIDFYRNSSISWPFYDKITTVYPVLELPIALIEHNVRAYDLENIQINQDAAQTLLENQLHERLQSVIGESGFVESFSYSARVQDEWLNVTLQAQCQEEIGIEVPGNYGSEELVE